MKVLLALAFVTCQVSEYYSQQFFGGVNSSFYADDLPPDLYGTIDGGYCWKHFSTALQFTSCMGYRPTSFQLLGLKERVYIRPRDKMFNFFLEIQMSTQVSGKRKGAAIDYNFLPVQEYRSSYEGDRFLKANSQGSANVGLSIFYKGFQLYGSFGFSERSWSGYKIYSVNTITTRSTDGHILTVGMNYFIGAKKDKKAEKPIK